MSDVTIPEDIRAKAEAISQELVDHAFKHGKLVNAYLPEFIASAILYERDRAAKIAADNINAWSLRIGEGQTLADFIAQAIRSSHE
jgi:hypothetical protein